MEDIYQEILVRKKVDVAPAYLNMGVDAYIISYLKKTCENRCITEGFVKEGSVQVVKRGVGKIYGSHFTGDTRFEVEFSALVCHPMPGNIYEMVVTSITKVDLQGSVGPMNVIVNKQFHSDPVELKAIEKTKVGDKIRIEVIGKRFFPNGKEIRVGAKIVVGAGARSARKEKRSRAIGELDEEEDDASASVGRPAGAGSGTREEDSDEDEDEEEEAEVEAEAEAEDVELSDESEYEEEEEEEEPEKLKVVDPEKGVQEELVDESDVEEDEGGSDVEEDE